jgi:hypothetical protein
LSGCKRLDKRNFPTNEREKLNEKVSRAYIIKRIKNIFQNTFKDDITYKKTIFFLTNSKELPGFGKSALARQPYGK